MSLIYYNPDEMCDQCHRMFDSWTDLHCPYCPQKPTPEYIEPDFKDMSMHQRANHLFNGLIESFNRKNKL